MPSASPHLLLLNPNTRAALTASLVEQVQACWAAMGLPDAPRLLGATAPFGADYIASEQTYTVAAHAVLDAWHQHVLEHGRPRAVLVACFGDPGVWALRECAGVPVMGLAEAAMCEADEAGPFAIVTGGRAWGPMLERLARGLRLKGLGHLRHVHTVEASGGELLANQQSGLAALSQACAHLLDQDSQALMARLALDGQLPQDAPGAATRSRDARPLANIILGGAALGGWANALQPQLPVPLIDSVAAGARWLAGQA
jgi:allantoin racemase